MGHGGDKSLWIARYRPVPAITAGFVSATKSAKSEVKYLQSIVNLSKLDGNLHDTGRDRPDTGNVDPRWQLNGFAIGVEWLPFAAVERIGPRPVVPHPVHQVGTATVAAMKPGCQERD